MSDKPIGELRRRMIADMTIRSFSEKTQRDYIRQVEAFASFLGRSPDTATGDDIRRFQFAQVEQGARPPKMNTQASALRRARALQAVPALDAGEAYGGSRRGAAAVLRHPCTSGR